MLNDRTKNDRSFKKQNVFEEINAKDGTEKIVFDDRCCGNDRTLTNVADANAAKPRRQICL